MGDCEPVQSRGVPRTGGHSAVRQRLTAVACLLAVTGAGLLLSLWPGQSVEERLRAIDAAYEIPDEENAAVAYKELAWDYAGPSLDPSVLPQHMRDVALVQPWRSAEYPQAAEWLEARRPVIDTLMDIGRKPNCRFSVWEARWQAGRRSSAAPEWSLLLLQAANNDLGEGRTEAGLEKLKVVLLIARHFHTQIDPWDKNTGRAFLSTGLRRF